jgi:hypothetical protein
VRSILIFPEYRGGQLLEEEEKAQFSGCSRVSGLVSQFDDAYSGRGSIREAGRGENIPSGVG